MRLPVELFLIISKHLDDARDLVRLRQVCREWRSFVDEFCLDELILFVGVYPTLELWRTNSQPIDFKKLICFPSDRCPLDHEGFRYTFRNIKRLFLSIRSEKQVSYQLGKFINKVRFFQISEKIYFSLDFDKLNKLEITRFYSDYANFRGDTCHDSRKKLKSGVWFELNLPSLTIFHINELDENIVMDCPKVTLFSFEFIEDYSYFTGPLHYKQIKQVNCYKAYKSSFRKPNGRYSLEFHKWIKKLENLEALYINSFCDAFDPHFLKYFPKLKILFFHECYNPNILAIEQEKQNLNRTDLAIYYLGRKYEDRILRRFQCGDNFCCCDFIEFYKDDLTKLAPTLPQYDALRYDDVFEISEDFNMQFYKALFAKLTDVQVLRLSKPSPTQEEIVELINSFKNIVILFVDDGNNLEQSFYDLLPDRYPYLRVLKVDNRNFANLKLDFLFKFNELYKVEFSKTEFVQDKSDYQALKQKIERKKEQIMRIGRKFLFDVDEEIMDFF